MTKTKTKRTPPLRSIVKNLYEKYGDFTILLDKGDLKISYGSIWERDSYLINSIRRLLKRDDIATTNYYGTKLTGTYDPTTETIEFNGTSRHREQSNVQELLKSYKAELPSTLNSIRLGIPDNILFSALEIYGFYISDKRPHLVFDALPLTDGPITKLYSTKCTTIGSKAVKPLFDFFKKNASELEILDIDLSENYKFYKEEADRQCIPFSAFKFDSSKKENYIDIPVEELVVTFVRTNILNITSRLKPITKDAKIKSKDVKIKSKKSKTRTRQAS